MIANDWLDHDFIANYTVASTRWPSTCSSGRRPAPPQVTGIAEKAIRQAAEWWGTAQHQLPAARPRHRAPEQGRAERAGCDQHGAGLRAHRPAELRLRHDHRPGQRPGRARARPEVRPAARLARPRQPRAPRLRGRRLGHGPGRPARATASTPTRSSASIDRGEIKGLLSICFNPARLAARQRVCPRPAGEAGLLRRHRLLSQRERPLRRHRAAGLAARGRRGHRHPGRGPRHQDQQGGRSARRRPPGLAHLSRTSPGRWAGSGG